MPSKTNRPCGGRDLSWPPWHPPLLRSAHLSRWVFICVLHIRWQYLQGDLVLQSPSSSGFYRNKKEGGPQLEEPGAWSSLSHSLSLPGLLAAFVSSLTWAHRGGSPVFTPPPTQSQGSVCSFLTTEHFSSVQDTIKTSYNLHLAFLGCFHGNTFLGYSSTAQPAAPNVSPLGLESLLVCHPLGRCPFSMQLLQVSPSPPQTASETDMEQLHTGWSCGVGTKALVGEALEGSWQPRPQGRLAPIRLAQEG